MEPQQESIETQAITRVPQEAAKLSIERDPDRVLAEARKAALALKGVIDKKARKVVFNGKTYLEYEDWLTVARFYGVTARVKSTAFVEYGDARGFEATAEALLVASDQVISQADALCLNDEENWGTRKKYKWVKDKETGRADKIVVGEDKVPLFQLKSMAQTRACAKALRNVLAWVVVLAGYAPTPAEEMAEIINAKNETGSREAQQAVVETKLAEIEEEEKETSQAPKKGCISQPQQKRLWAIAKQAGWQNDQIKQFLKAKYSIEHTADIPKDKYEEMCTFLEAGTLPPSDKDTKSLKSSSQETGETKGRSVPPETSPHNKPQEPSFNLQPPAPSPGDWIPSKPDDECTIGRDSITRIDPKQDKTGKYWLAENGSGGKLTVFDKTVAAHVASMLNRDLLVAVKKSGQYTNLVAIKALEAK